MKFLKCHLEPPSFLLRNTVDQKLISEILSRDEVQIENQGSKSKQLLLHSIKVALYETIYDMITDMQ